MEHKTIQNLIFLRITTKDEVNEKYWGLKCSKTKNLYIELFEFVIYGIFENVQQKKWGKY